jgi:hypothetical protein
MNYLTLLIILLSTTYVHAQANVANIVMSRGKDVYVYSAGKKITIEAKTLPFQLSPGDEVQLGLDSDCELVFSNSDTMYAGSESLFSVDFYKNNMNYIWVKYGSLLYRGTSAAVLKASDLFVTSKSGDFFVRYKRSGAEATILNFGTEMSVKQGDDPESYPLMTNRFIRLVSFKNEKTYGSINPAKIQVIYDTFRIIFSPTEVDGTNITNKDKMTSTPQAINKANIDFIRRTIGL